MNKRVHQIAKERGVPAKDVLARLQAAGLKVKAVSSSVDEAEARRVLGDGNGAGEASPPQPARAEQPRDGAGERSPSRDTPEQPRPERPAAESGPAARAESRPAARAE